MGRWKKRHWPSAPAPNVPPVSAAERRACLDKTRHTTRGAAMRTADYERVEFGVVLVAYPCDFCGGWHLSRG